MLAGVAGRSHAQPSEPSGELPNMTVELHAHLFMKQGLGWLFRGDFDGPLLADDWSDRLSSKVNAASLDASGNGIVIVSLFAHPAYRGDVRAAIREQIARTEQFAARHPDWSIARSASQAEALLRSGQRVLVLSLEGAGGVLESEADLREFVDRRGIAIVGPLHLVDDRFGGAASLTGYQYLGNPLNASRQALRCASHDSQGAELNPRGLTTQGEALVQALLARGVWIDLTHASEAALLELVPMVRAANQPLLFTHTSLRRYRPAERALSDSMLEQVAASRGVVGLLPSADAFERGVADPSEARSVQAFAAMAGAVAAALGSEALMLGGDWNGGMRHLEPTRGTHTELDDEPGLFHMGQTPILWSALSARGVAPSSGRATLRYFLTAWARVRAVPGSTKAHRNGRLPLRRDALQGPSAALRFATGVFTPLQRPAPQAWLSVDARIRKDQGFEPAVEPVFYLAHSRFELLRGADENHWSHVKLAFSPVGVRAREGDTQLEGELVPLAVRRRDDLGERLGLRAAAARGRARLVPGMFHRAAGNLYLDIDTVWLGYDGSANNRPEPGDRLRGDMLEHGAFIAAGRLELGWSAWPDETHPIRFFATGDVDLSVGPGFGARSALSAGGGIRVRLFGAADVFASGQWLGRTPDGVRLFSATRAGGGLMAEL